MNPLPPISSNATFSSNFFERARNLTQTDSDFIQRGREHLLSLKEEGLKKIEEYKARIESINPKIEGKIAEFNRLKIRLEKETFTLNQRQHLHAPQVRIDPNKRTVEEQQNYQKLTEDLFSSYEIVDQYKTKLAASRWIAAKLLTQKREWEYKKNL